MAHERPSESPRFLLDTGALLQGLDLPPEACWTTPSVLGEIDSKGATGRRAGYFLSAGLHVQSPSPAARARAEAVAQASGVLSRLSSTDLDVLGLSIDLGGELVTDDYSVQDVAAGLGIRWRSATTAGIQTRKTWTARCSGCGRSYAADKDRAACAVCGAEIRLRARK